MHASPHRRIGREFEELDHWRSTDIVWGHYTKNKRGRKIWKDTRFDNPLYTASLLNDNIRTWVVTIPEEDFVINIIFPPNYPFVPPIFTTPNSISNSCIDSYGKIDIINYASWSPALTAGACLLIIISNLFPNLNDTIAMNRQIVRTDQYKLELCERTGLICEDY